MFGIGIASRVITGTWALAEETWRLYSTTATMTAHRKTADRTVTTTEAARYGGSVATTCNKPIRVRLGGLFMITKANWGWRLQEVSNCFNIWIRKVDARREPYLRHYLPGCCLGGEWATAGREPLVCHTPNGGRNLVVEPGGPHIGRQFLVLWREVQV